MQRWPDVPNAPNTAPSVARSRSASGRTTMAFLPPSSSDNSRGPDSMAAAATLRPVGTEPVKLRAPTPGWTASAAAGSARPCTTWTRSAGTPASTHAATNASQQAGACSLGLMTTPLPARSAGKIFHDGIATGKFQGVISPTTPTGWRVVQHSLSPSSDGTVSPQADRPWPATKTAMSTASCTSPPASTSTLPASRLTRSVRGALAAASLAPAAAMTSARAGAGRRTHSR